MKECLIVDDSRVMRKIARKIVEGFQFQVDEAEDGASALDFCRKKMPDAILLDWNMPNAPGVDFLRAIRREQSGSKPVIVCCTTENDVTNITEAVGAGATDYLLKPYDRDTLKQKFSETGLI